MNYLYFIDKNEYSLPTWFWDGPDMLRWELKGHSGLVKKNSPSNHKRPVDTGKTEKVKVGEDIKTGEPVYEEQPVIDYQTFYPFDEAVASGHVPEFDQAAWDEKQAKEQKEQQRIALQNERDKRLSEITHDFGDGRVVQARPSDALNFQVAIEEGQPEDWVLADNTVAQLTVAEMQEALQTGKQAAKQVWNWYTGELKKL